MHYVFTKYLANNSECTCVLLFPPLWGKRVFVVSNAADNRVFSLTYVYLNYPPTA